MFENAYYSVISPEGCAAILWKDAGKKEEAAFALRLTAQDLHLFGIVDEIIPEPGAAHLAPAKAAESLKAALKRHLAELSTIDEEDLVRLRYEKLRRIGIYREGQKNFGGALRANVDEFLAAARGGPGSAAPPGENGGESAQP